MYTFLFVPWSPGCVLLDLEGEAFPSIVDSIVLNLVKSHLLPVEASAQVRTLLLMKHKHTSEATLWEKIKNSATGEEKWS